MITFIFNPGALHQTHFSTMHCLTLGYQRSHYSRINSYYSVYGTYSIPDSIGTFYNYKSQRYRTTIRELRFFNTEYNRPYW